MRADLRYLQDDYSRLGGLLPLCVFNCGVWEADEDPLGLEPSDLFRAKLYLPESLWNCLS